MRIRTLKKTSAAVILAGFISSDGSALATTCTADASPSSDCTFLYITQPRASLSIGGGLTVGSETQTISYDFFGGMTLPFSLVIEGDVSGTLVNGGTVIASGNQSHAILVPEITTSVGGISNNGTISAADPASMAIENYGTIGFIINNGTITGGQYGILSTNSVGRIYNAAGSSITGTDVAGIGVWTWQNLTTSITSVINFGTIQGNDAIKLFVSDSATSNIGEIFNFGSISSNGSGYSINNASGSIGTLNNLQGASGSGGSALTFGGILPARYNVVIYGSRYGQLAVDSGNFSGTMAFGVFAGDAANGLASSQLTTGVYEDVVTGIGQTAFTNTFTDGAAFGSHDGVAWKLTDAQSRGGAATSWDLTVLNVGTDVAEPQRAMLEQRQRAVRMGLDYDCIRFDQMGGCASLQARRSDLGDNRETAAALTIAMRITPELRVGTFLDARTTDNTVDGVRMNAGSPMFGAFVGYSRNPEGTGLGGRLSAAYETGTADIAHANLLGSAGTVTGSADVDTLGVSARLGWGLGIEARTLVTPYIGIRYTEAKRAAYSETYGSGTVEDPFSFAAYGEYRATGTVGADLNGLIGPDLAYRVGAGVDYDFVSALDGFSARSALIGDISYVSVAKARKAHPFGQAGLAYGIDDATALTLGLNVSRLDYGNDLGYSALAGFQMGF